MSSIARQPAVPAHAVPSGTPWPALAAIVALAAALRFATLRTQSIWFDEAATWELVRMSFGGMLHAIPHRESSPPLYYAAEWVWTRAFGDGAFGLRSLSALAGTLTVPIAYAIGRRVGGAGGVHAGLADAGAELAGGRAGSVPARAGLAAAALVAVNPLLIWFSQEARSYALVVLLSAAALLCFLRARDEPERAPWLAWWAAFGALALATHYFAVFVLAPQAALLLWRHPRRRATLAAVGALVAVGAALLPLLLAQRGNPYDIAASSIELRLVQVPKQFLLGYRGPLPVAAGVAGAALALGGAWLLARRVERTPRERALTVAAIGAIGIALPLAGALIGADYLNARNALPALAPLLAALGVAYGASRPARLGAVLLAALCTLSLALVVAVAADRSYQRPDWRGLAAALGRGDGPRALVISPGNGDAPLRYYLRHLRTMSPTGAAVREVDVVAVAGSTSPGAAPKLPAQVGTVLGVAGFGPPRRIATHTYELLRFRSAKPIYVTPLPLTTVRFSAGMPAVDTLLASP